MSQSIAAEAAPKKFSTMDIVLVGLFAALTAVCSWISIPAPAPLAPFTLQTFAVFCALEILGGKRGFFAVLVYIILGAAGVPVFAQFTGGPGVLFGTTGGYIIGFLFSAGIYWVMEALLGNKLWVRVVSLIAGLLVCYAFGTVWFMIVYAQNNPAVGLGTALMWCVVPFLLPDAAKMALALGIASAVKKRVHV